MLRVWWLIDRVTSISTFNLNRGVITKVCERKVTEVALGHEHAGVKWCVCGKLALNLADLEGGGGNGAELSYSAQDFL
jgi:hypothetical protein